MAVSVCVVGDVADALIDRLKSRISVAHQERHGGRRRHRAAGHRRASRKSVAGYIDHGVADGARIVCDGRTHR